MYLKFSCTYTLVGEVKVSVVAFKQAPKELKPNDVRDLPAGYVKSEYPEVWDLLRTYSILYLWRLG
jgi:hypothetical protein